MKEYGNLINRLQEGNNFTGREIKVGDDITEYLWSDRECYYVTNVVNQKHIFVKSYHVCADHDKAKGMGHQDWLYFKSIKEQEAYLNKFRDDDNKVNLDNVIENKEAEWVFRYNKWNRKVVLDSGKVEYYKLSGNISFGVRNYHYDWEF